MFNEPTDVAASSTYVYVADMLNHRIRRISTANGWTTTLAGSGSGAFRDGTGAAASFNRPRGVALSTDGLTLYVADERNARIRQIVISSGVVSTLAGSGVVGFADGTGTSASFRLPLMVAASATTLFVTDGPDHRIGAVVLSSGVVTTLAGSGLIGSSDGTATAASVG